MLLIATVIVYIPSLRAGFIMDDNAMLTENPLIAAADGIRRFWYTAQPVNFFGPVTASTLWIEWRLWGLHPFGYHATNLALHCAEVLLLWGILRRLRLPGAWLAARADRTKGALDDSRGGGCNRRDSRSRRGNLASGPAIPGRPHPLPGDG